MKKAQVPRISLPPLAEYMDADIQRRHEIVRQSLQDNDAAAFRYSRARDAVRDALADGPPYSGSLLDAADRFERREPNGEWDESDLEFSAQGLRHLADLTDQLRLGDRPPRSKRRWPKLMVSGVEVSIAPDVLIWAQTSNGIKIGALKIRWNQRPMSEKEGEFASTLLRVSLREVLQETDSSVDYKRCQVVDVFADQIYVAPRWFKRRMGRIEKACDEFRLHWTDRITDAVERRLPRPGVQPSSDDQRPQPGVH